MIKKILTFATYIIILINSSTVFGAPKSKSTYEYLDLFGQVFDRVKSSYVEDVSDKELIEKAIDGMLTGLDPHSGYMNEEVWQEMQMDTQGKFGGLGIEITMEEGFVKVISPIEDTPAFKAGVLAGDYIIQIDDTPVFGLTLNEAVELMRGEKGSAITITISRAGLEPFEINIVRDFIKIRSVKHEIYDDIGYLRITSFTEQTEEGLIKSINQIKKDLNEKERGYVLDLRSNPGGLLTQAVKVTDIFLQRGEIVSTRGREKKDITRYRAKNKDETNSKPLVVLINGGSASASEIVAGALQDHRRAIIIGTQSFGKGSVQTIIPFQKSNSEQMSGIRLTTARYYTPSGKSIQGMGITPDIIIEQGEFESYEYRTYSESDLKESLDKEEIDETKNEDDSELSEKEKRLVRDYQLKRALDLLKGMSLFEESLEN
ncbi:MAG: Carboxy-terminal processing protease CtpA [Alphaproteobacteria bacterium MarineAlpha5_Bin5]|nr:MAG: Carboxy-terminal processing protease CtpA [Alphaproteobacteria bacterium MarineAlpha5_Bin5]PPR52807.1 MAG: Carboxy-terminal processing protease CtpA [Alphaproteobacteria bacterium MarineAlpha5_Bin4]|tara:strand:+ start:16282 stop:17574 length:1293 start_codon:yes stop_codon:yes gene_type:complete